MVIYNWQIIVNNHLLDDKEKLSIVIINPDVANSNLAIVFINSANVVWKVSVEFINVLFKNINSDKGNLISKNFYDYMPGTNDRGLNINFT